MARFGAEVRVSRAEAELLQQKMSATEAVVTKFNGDLELLQVRHVNAPRLSLIASGCGRVVSSHQIYSPCIAVRLIPSHPIPSQRSETKLELLQVRVHQHLSKVQGSTAEPAAARASDAKRPSLAQIMTGKSKSAGSSPASVKFTLKKASELMGGEEDEETVTRGHEHGDTASGKLEKTASFVSEGDSGYHESPGSARGKAAPPRHADVKHSRLRCVYARTRACVCPVHDRGEGGKTRRRGPVRRRHDTNTHVHAHARAHTHTHTRAGRRHRRKRRGRGRLPTTCPGTQRPTTTRPPPTRRFPPRNGSPSPSDPRGEALQRRRRRR